MPTAVTTAAGRTRRVAQLRTASREQPTGRLASYLRIEERELETVGLARRSLNGSGAEGE
jgi:hypothetical protein